MGKFNDRITEEHADFIQKQHMFFVCTAPLSKDGHINLSPKGLDSFKVLSPNKVAYMDLIGSGNETSAHILENGRITFMFCAFEGAPNILRLYGNGYTVTRDHLEWDELATHFQIYSSTRQIIVADIFKTQTSCGFGVPYFEYRGERDVHFAWANKKDEAGLSDYIKEKNLCSIDGLPSAISKSGL